MPCPMRVGEEGAVATPRFGTATRHHNQAVSSFSAATSSPRRVRSVAAWVVATVGAVDLVQAVTPPLTSRVEVILDVLPIDVSAGAAGVIVGVGLALLLLARAVSRGRRRALVAVVGLLSVSVVLHLFRGLDVEAAAVSLAALVFLVWKRAAFAVPGRPAREVLSSVAAGTGVIVAVAVAIGVVVAVAPSIRIGGAIEAVVERVAWIEASPLPAGIDRWLTAAMHGLGVGIVLLAVRLLLMPAVAVVETRRDFGRAAAIVAAHGNDTLAYFALRDDKEWFFHGGCLVAYGVFGDVRLVAPDPVGPEDRLDDAWSAFMAEADAAGHAVAVLGASESWVPRYERHGFKSMYLGDEAIIDCEGFSLEGRRVKKVREAVGRATRAGYRAELLDPAAIDEDLRGRLRVLWSSAHGDDPERGFSMTLGRAFEKRDAGLLLAVAFDASGNPAGFCQFVPARLGYSLDTMRRDRGDHPNGLMDFLVARTAEHLAGQGGQVLGLNFAVMKAVLRGEGESSPLAAAERWILERMAEGTQIRSLYRYNDKFDPRWVPRHLVFRTSLDLPGVALAVARAESLWEIPVVGRLLKRMARRRAGAAPLADQGASVPR